MFLGLAAYAASKIGPEVPIIVPENGPISLNVPLNPSRRGSCSTRTDHPYFLSSISVGMRLLGITNPISNPYSLKTKGQMVAECKVQSVLAEGYQLTNSCGKAGRKTHWANRNAKACGTCVPCLLRRAALHANDMDEEAFGDDALTSDPSDFPDFLALLGFVGRNLGDSKIKKALIANSRFPMAALGGYTKVVRDMRDEVSAWIAEKGSPNARRLAGIRGE